MGDLAYRFAGQRTWNNYLPGTIQATETFPT